MSGGRTGCCPPENKDNDSDRHDKVHDLAHAVVAREQTRRQVSDMLVWNGVVCGRKQWSPSSERQQINKLVVSRLQALS